MNSAFTTLRVWSTPSSSSDPLNSLPLKLSCDKLRFAFISSWWTRSCLTRFPRFIEEWLEMKRASLPRFLRHRPRFWRECQHKYGYRARFIFPLHRFQLPITTGYIWFITLDSITVHSGYFRTHDSELKEELGDSTVVAHSQMSTLLHSSTLLLCVPLPLIRYSFCLRFTFFPFVCIMHYGRANDGFIDCLWFASWQGRWFCVCCRGGRGLCWLNQDWWIRGKHPW